MKTMNFDMKQIALTIETKLKYRLEFVMRLFPPQNYYLVVEITNILCIHMVMKRYSYLLLDFPTFCLLQGLA